MWPGQRTQRAIQSSRPETPSPQAAITPKDIAAGTIYISTTDPVTNSGDGVTIDEKGQSTSDAYKNLKFDCSAVTGANLTLKDMFLENRSDTSPLVNFAGPDNKPNFEGTVVMDKYGSGQGTYTSIHVSLPWG